jgi:hypothetical protein
MKHLATFSSTNGTKLKVCVPINYCWSFEELDVDFNYGIARGIELLATDGTTSFDSELISRGLTSGNGGINSVEFTDTDTPFGYYPAYALDLFYRVIDKVIIRNGIDLRNTTNVKDFKIKQDAQNFINTLSTVTQSIPTNNNILQGDFNYIKKGQTVNISEKALVALPSWGAYKKDKTGKTDPNPWDVSQRIGCLTSHPQTYQFTKDGKLIHGIDTGFDIPIGADCFDNHSIGCTIPIPFGNYQLQVTNKIDDSLVAGIMHIRQNPYNYAYAMYHSYNPDLRMGLVYADDYKEVKANETQIINCNIINDSIYGDQPNATHVQFLTSLIVNGKIYQGHYGGTLGNHRSTYLKLNEIVRIRITALDETNTWIDLDVDTNNRNVTVIDSSNCSISEAHTFISIRSTYNESNGHFNGNNEYYKTSYKVFNNKGNIVGNSPDIKIINQDYGDKIV